MPKWTIGKRRRDKIQNYQMRIKVRSLKKGSEERTTSIQACDKESEETRCKEEGRKCETDGGGTESGKRRKGERTQVRNKWREKIRKGGS